MNEFLNIDNSKSYATEEDLVKALTKANLLEQKHLTVCNRSGRFTAIFFLCRLSQGVELPAGTYHNFMLFN